MELTGHTVLITGGASGIGLALTERFLAARSRVIICGRRRDKLEEVQARFPELHIRVCDLAQAAERVALVQGLLRDFPDLDVVINNAGIQRRLQLAQGEEWAATHAEFAINLEAPVHLCQLVTPHLAQQARAFLINVSSGLSFAPLASVPVYSASKAALHSFTQSLRHQLASTSIRVIEIIPPAVNTDLGGPGLHAFGVPVDAFADAVVKGLQAGDLEIAYGSAAHTSKASRAELDVVFNKMNQSQH